MHPPTPATVLLNPLRSSKAPVELTSAHVVHVRSHENVSEERIPPSPPSTPTPGRLFQQRSPQQPVPCLVAATTSVCVQECDDCCETATATSQEMMQHLFYFIQPHRAPNSTFTHTSSSVTEKNLSQGCDYNNRLLHPQEHTPSH